MNSQSTENSNSTEKKCLDSADRMSDIHVTIQPSEQKPRAPKWWDILGWILRFIVALGTLLKLLKDKD